MVATVLGLVVLGLSGCASAYYGALEKVGIAKRELLADRVEATRSAQQEAKEQFASALEQMLALTGESGGALKTAYDGLAGELKRSEARATEVHERIAGVRSVAEALFDEWQDELAAYTSPTLRQRSESQLRATRSRYDRLMVLMTRAADRMEPVLVTLRDQVLFLKHNLNAQTVAGLDGTARSLETEVGQLIADMERAIAEAELFLAAWAKDSGT